jgi:hypothetical protein
MGQRPGSIRTSADSVVERYIDSVTECHIDYAREFGLAINSAAECSTQDGGESGRKWRSKQ